MSSLSQHVYQSLKKPDISKTLRANRVSQTIQNLSTIRSQRVASQLAKMRITAMQRNLKPTKVAGRKRIRDQEDTDSQDGSNAPEQLTASFLNVFGRTELQLMEDLRDPFLQSSFFQKQSRFLVTINTNKQPFVTESNPDAPWRTLEQFQNVVDELCIKFFRRKDSWVPMLHQFGSITPYNVDEIIYKYVTFTMKDIGMEKGVWETGPSKKRLHVHFIVWVNYLSLFQGYFHLSRSLKEYIRENIPWINWNRGPYINIRYMKNLEIPVEKYIAKLKNQDATNTLVAHTLKKITDYQAQRNQNLMQT